MSLPAASHLGLRRSRKYERQSSIETLTWTPIFEGFLHVAQGNVHACLRVPCISTYDLFVWKEIPGTCI
jgi:hypothetical protein